MREFILLRDRNGSWSLFVPTKGSSHPLLLASGHADWNVVEGQWSRPCSSDYETANRKLVALQKPRPRSSRDSLWTN